MLNAPKEQLSAGDRAPNFVLPDHKGKFRMFYDEVTGRPVVMLLAGSFQPPILPAPLQSFQKHAKTFDTAGIDLFCICPDASEHVQSMMPGLQLWADPERKITDAYLNQLGMGSHRSLENGTVAAILMDANQRVLTVISGKDSASAEAALEFYAARPEMPPAQVRPATAPVITMPDLLDPAMCKALMDLFETGNVEEGKVGSVLAGKEVERVHHERKKRLDHKIEDPEMHRTLQQIIGRRVAPEVNKAFNFQGFKFDRFLVCRYAADRADRFTTHRDNVSPETADRRFAMTLNLNGDDYEGGELVFPEYGPDRYKPGSGGAVIFSCSLLHEALPVTEGVRFALLTFLRALPPQQGGRAA